MTKLDVDKTWEGSTYYSEKSTRVDGFCSVDVESFSDSIGVHICTFVYDQGAEQSPTSIFVKLTVEQAKEFGKQVLLAAKSEEIENLKMILDKAEERNTFLVKEYNRYSYCNMTHLAMTSNHSNIQRLRKELKELRKKWRNRAFN